MGNTFLFFIESDGGASGISPTDPLMPHSLSGHWLSHIVTFIGNSRYLYDHGSLVLQEAINCMSRLSGAVVLWLATRSTGISSKIQGDCVDYSSGHGKSYTQIRHISSVKCDLTGVFYKGRCKRKSSVFNKISILTLRQLFGEAEWIQSFPVLSLAAALVPPFTNVATNILAIPQETDSINAHISVEQRPFEIENRGCGSPSDLCLQSLDLSKNAIEPRTGIEFPTMLDSSIDGGNASGFPPEVLVGTGSRIMTIIRIKSLKVYAFGFYVHPFDICEKLGPKYACIPEYELNKGREFYQDLLREDINMTIRLVVSCNGIKISTVKEQIRIPILAAYKPSVPCSHKIFP